MPKIEETAAIARKILPIIYVLDISGSMSGEKIGQVNEAMREVETSLKEISDKNPDAEIRVGVISFSDDVNWITNGLEKMEHWIWQNVEPSGCTELGKALNELNNKLSRKELLSDNIGYNMPVIIFMTDGVPTDDYAPALTSIKKNKWFKYGIKIGIAIGEDADKNVVSKITGNVETVITIDDISILQKLIVKVSVTASKIGSKSHTEETSNDSAVDIVKQTINEIKQEEGNAAQVSADGVFDDSGW